MNEDGTQKRLSAILAADVVGYTRLMEEDSDGTVNAWKTAFADIVDPVISNYAGRIVKRTGDGFLVEFTTIQNAVQCAIDMQEELASNPLDFRMGVSLGDIIDDGDDIHGEDVNIAARIEAIAEPGCICISGMAYEAVRNQIDAGFRDLGKQDVKHVSAPVQVYHIDPDIPRETIQHARGKARKTRRIAAAVFLLAFIVGGAGWWQSRSEFDPVDPASMAFKLPDKPSIAVLSFDYFGSDKKENAYLADGLSEQIIARSKFPRA